MQQVLITAMQQEPSTKFPMLLLLFSGTAGAIIAVVLDRLVDFFWRKRERQYARLYQVQSYFHDQYLNEKLKTARKTIAGNNVFKADQQELQWRISVVLQRVGIMVYAGGIPIEYTLAMNAPQFVADWAHCCEWTREQCWGIDCKKTSNTVPDEALQLVPFHRRHAEWLGLIAWMWLVNRRLQGMHLDKNSKDALISIIKLYGTPREIFKREKMLFEIDSKSMQPLLPKCSVWRIRHFAQSEVAHLETRKLIDKINGQ